MTELATDDLECTCEQKLNREEEEDEEDDEMEIDGNKNNSNDNCRNFIQGINFDELKKEYNCTDEELVDMILKVENEMSNESTRDLSKENQNGQNYGSPSYWEERYILCNDLFDWYSPWNSIESIVSPFLTGDELVLNIGCGNSKMSEDMHNSLGNVIVNIDISDAVIKQMQERYKDIPDLIWFTMDCSKMDFEDDMFDVVFDKGTFDALLCGQNAISIVYQTMREMHRILKNGGLFIEITYGIPQNRLTFFKGTKLPWKLYDPISVKDKNNQITYIYIFQKMTNDLLNNSEVDKII